MQTTLRINDELYREAKALAARQGVTLTRFIEDGIRLKLAPKPAPTPFRFRVYDAGEPFPFTNEDLRRIANEEQEKHDFAKLGMFPVDPA
jgi:hypothetical protein